jgi:hypothetical protein
MTINRRIHSTVVSLWFVFIGAQAQSNGKTDTGGGMGGTGNHPVRELMADISAELSPLCEKKRAVGNSTRHSVIKNLSTTIELVCVGQTLKTQLDETQVINFHLGGRLEVSQGANFSIEQTLLNESQYLVLLHAGEFQIIQNNEPVRYAIKAKNAVELNLVTNKRLFVSLNRTAVQRDLYSQEILVWPVGPESIAFTLGAQTITAAAGQKTRIEISVDGIPTVEPENLIAPFRP